MILAQGSYRSPRARHPDGPETIGSPAHERMLMLELASTLEEWPARNIVFRRRLEQVAREIVRLAGAQPGAEPASP